MTTEYLERLRAKRSDWMSSIDELRLAYRRSHFKVKEGWKGQPLQFSDVLFLNDWNQFLLPNIDKRRK
jgi:hypothetical protein